MSRCYEARSESSDCLWHCSKEWQWYCLLHWNSNFYQLWVSRCRLPRCVYSGARTDSWKDYCYLSHLQCSLCFVWSPMSVYRFLPSSYQHLNTYTIHNLKSHLPQFFCSLPGHVDHFSSWRWLRSSILNDFYETQGLIEMFLWRCIWYLWSLLTTCHSFTTYWQGLGGSEQFIQKTGSLVFVILCILSQLLLFFLDRKVSFRATGRHGSVDTR